MLKLPRTIGGIEWEDDSENSTKRKGFTSEKYLDLVEGYKFFTNIDANFAYTFFAEINIDYDRLWDLLNSLANTMPDEVALLFGLYDYDLNYGDYTAKEDVVFELSKYKKEIAEDCRWEFGLIFQTEDEFIEIFVPEAKYVRFWGNDEVTFRAVMSSYSLNELKELKFVDEYSKTVVPLSTIDESVASTEIIIENLTRIFTSN